MNKIKFYRLIAIVFIVIETFTIIEGYINIHDSLLMISIIIFSIFSFKQAFANKQTLAIVMYFFVLLIHFIIESKLVNIAWFAGEILAPITIVCIYNTLIYNRDFRGLKIITFFGLSILFILSIPTVIALNFNPNILRDANSLSLQYGDAGTSSLLRMGLLKYEVIHSIPFLLPILVYYFKFQKKNLQRLILLIFISLEYYLLLKASFATPLILATVVILFSLLKIKKTTSKIIITLCTLLIIFTSLNNLSIISVLQNIQPIFENTAINEKITDINDSMETGETQGQVAGRKDLYEKSWDTFLRNPLFGNADGSTVGEHSFFIDRLAYFGIIGSIPFFLFFYFTFKTQYRLIPKELKYIYILSIMTFIILGFLKNIAGFEPYLYIFIFLPGITFANLPNSKAAHSINANPLIIRQNQEISNFSKTK